MVSLDDVRDVAEKFLTGKWGDPVVVTDIEKVFGGASRETYQLQIKVATEQRGIILRRDPPGSLIETERELEYNAYVRIFPTDIPVPEPLFLENDTSYLGQPFSVMAAIEGCATDVSTLDAAQKAVIGHQKWNILGRLASFSPVDLGFTEFMEAPRLDECAGQQLDCWERVIIDDEIHPQPITRAAIRWLRRNMPPAAMKLAVVHGDYRTGNFLFDPEEGIKGILDWEMCHLGDPLEDLAWSMDPLWNLDTPLLAGQLLPHGQATAIWEEASGLKVDPVAFRWWRIFVSVKAMAIWISSSREFHQGESKDSILAMAGWVMSARQNKILLEYLKPDPAAPEEY